MNKFKVIFCGTPKISAGILETLIDMKEIEVVLAITQPDRPVGRKKEVVPTPVKELALKNGINVIQPDKVGNAVDLIAEYNADFLVTCAYGQFVPDKVLNLFNNCINVHASLLPKYRGGSPIQFAILNGEKETGISLMKMIKKMDAGEVYIQEKIVIDKNDNAGTMFIKMEELGKSMINKYLIDIFTQKIKGIKQNESEVSFAYNISGDGEKIPWYKTSLEVHNFIRALTPRPIPFCVINNERWKIAETVVVEDVELIQKYKSKYIGEVCEISKNGIIIKTGDGVVKILQIQRPGKKMISAGTFYGQNILKIGDILE